MKKIYLKKSAILAALAVAFIAVSCGLTFVEITFSTHEPMQGETLKIVTKYKRVEGDYTNNKNIWLYYAIRVPQDWESAEALKAWDEAIVKDENTGEESTVSHTDYEFETSKFYSTLLDEAYPREGYKWIAYQTTKQYDVNGQPTEATAELKVGQTLGTYQLDIVSGSSTSSPDELLKPDGTIDYDLAYNLLGENNVNLKDINGVKHISFQEYLLNVSTITEAEIEARKLSLAHIKANGYPITPLDIPNKGATPQGANMELTVIENTNAGIDEAVADGSKVNVVAVDGRIEVEAEGGIATVYDMTGSIIDTKVVNGAATLEARKGVCIVRVVNGARATVQKVVVK